jgi:ABC-type antimicrobial peptide transport system permease subunit
MSHRTREIGVRVALGAGRGEILRMVIADGMRPAVAGLVGGVALAWAGGWTIESLLFGVRANDPSIFVAVCVGLSIVALLAVAVPAARASRVDPLRSLRAD